MRRQEHPLHGGNIWWEYALCVLACAVAQPRPDYTWPTAPHRRSAPALARGHRPAARGHSGGAARAGRSDQPRAGRRDRQARRAGAPRRPPAGKERSRAWTEPRPSARLSRRVGPPRCRATRVAPAPLGLSECLNPVFPPHAVHVRVRARANPTSTRSHLLYERTSSRSRWRCRCDMFLKSNCSEAACVVQPVQTTSNMKGQYGILCRTTV